MKTEKKITANLTFLKLRQRKTSGYEYLKHNEDVIVSFSYPNISDNEVKSLRNTIESCSSFWINNSDEICFGLKTTIFTFVSLNELYKAYKFDANHIRGIKSLKRKKIIYGIFNGNNSGFGIFISLNLDCNLQIHVKRKVIFEKVKNKFLYYV